MSEPYLAEVRIVGFSFAPRGWALCDGQLLPINQNQALFSLLGTTYGGDGRTTFALPDLRGRTPIHVEGSVHRQGQRGGEERHALTVNELPSHRHRARALSVTATTGDPTGALPADSAGRPYRPCGTSAVMNSAAIGLRGDSQAHNNMQPYLALNFVIALQGLFPSRN